MSFDRLTPVWPLIIDLLVPSLPKPLSGVTKEEYCGQSPEEYARLPSETAPGATSREDIRATDLASLMRTSIAFNQLAAIKLYRTIITDDLLSLSVNFGQPSAHPEVASKVELLQYTLRLHLEYHRKGDGPSYRAIMLEDYQWQGVGILSRVETAKTQGTFETDRLSGAFAAYEPFRETLPDAFTKVNTLTVGAIFGGQGQFWLDLALSPVEMVAKQGDASTTSIGEYMGLCNSMVPHLFRHSPIKHFCQRGGAGPLSWSPVYNQAPNTPKLPSASSRFTLHYGLEETNPYPSAIAHKNRWVLEDDRRTASTTNDVCESIYDALDRAHEGSRERGRDKDIDIEIFASTPRALQSDRVGPGHRSGNRVMGPADERAALDRVRGEIQKARRRRGKGESKYVTSWKSSLDTPSCEACGWCPEYVAQEKVAKA